MFYFIEGNVFKLGTCFQFDSSQFKTYLKALNSFVILLARIYAWTEFSFQGFKESHLLSNSK